MTDSKEEKKDSRIPYEPPRLLSLGGGIAYAQDTVCREGGLPYLTQCTNGGTAQAGACKSGGTPSARCWAGGQANYNCKTGTTVTP